MEGSRGLDAFLSLGPCLSTRRNAITIVQHDMYVPSILGYMSAFQPLPSTRKKVYFPEYHQGGSKATDTGGSEYSGKQTRRLFFFQTAMHVDLKSIGTGLLLLFLNSKTTYGHSTSATPSAITVASPPGTPACKYSPLPPRSLLAAPQPPSRL